MSTEAANKVARLSISRIEQLERSSSEFRVLSERLSRTGRWAVVGGAPRDWLLRRKPRDLDIVVDCPEAQLSSIIASAFPSKRNRYGGFRLQLQGVAIDVWALASTWAFKRLSHVKPTFADLPKTTVFNIDSLLVTRDGDVYESGFFEAVRKRTLDLSFGENPYPILCAARALVLATRYQLTLADAVVDFVRRNAADGMDWRALSEAQRSHYGRVMISAGRAARLLPSEVALCLNRRPGS